ncbi:MAG TPA: tetratricopeptide repeat protein [Burkholderiaceae bacterium]|nr:tetratricopeptide repeat protein [Burkholderiaceae bacterium]
MSEYSIDVSQEDFSTQVLEASRTMPVVVDFWAPWCGPCKALGPILDRVVADFGGKLRLAKINTDENQELAAHYGVRGIPSVKAFIDGQLVDEFSGALSEPQVRRFLEGLLPSPAQPILLEAQAARQRGNVAQARTLLQRALELDPSHPQAQLDLADVEIESGNVEPASQLLAAFEPEDSSQRERFDALKARLKLAEAARGADALALAARVSADPTDLGARLALAQTLALREEYRGAFEQLLEIVQRDRSFRDDVGRKTMLTFFQILSTRPEAQDLVREYRTALARTLH